MPWLITDDKMRHHPKVAALSDKAFRLRENLRGHCAEFSTDGAVDKSSLRREMRSISARWRSVSELIAAGLLHETEDGYHVHDFLDYNRSANEVKEKRASDAERQRRSRERRHGVTHALVTAPVPDLTNKEQVLSNDDEPRPVDNSPWAHPPQPKPRPSTGDPELDAEMKRNRS